MAEMTEALIEEAVGGYAEIQRILALYGKDTAEGKERLEKAETFMVAQEDANQKDLLTRKAAENELKSLVERWEAAEKAGDEQKERIETLEAEIARKANVGKEANWRETDEGKAFIGFLKDGRQGMTQEEYKTLRTDVETGAGVLVPDRLYEQLLKIITEIDPIRALAKLVPTTTKSMEVAVENTIPTATYEGEAEAAAESQPVYNSENLTTFRQTFILPITVDQLQDSAFDMEAIASDAAAKAFAYGEGNAFIVGNAPKIPEGIINNAAIVTAKVASITDNEVNLEDMPALIANLKTGYTGTFVFNRTILARLRAEQTTAGAFKWPADSQNQLFGFDYALSPSMEDMANGSKSAMFGDFSAGYMILDRTGMTVLRDEVTSASTAIVKFIFRRWNTGRVVLPEAIKLLVTQ